MQRGRGDPFFGFGDPFGNFGGFGGQRSMFPSPFGGRDPFDDPFFTRPFGSMFEMNPFGSFGGPFMNPHAPGFLEHQPPPPPPHPNMSTGPIIEELNSDDEKDEEESGEEKRQNARKHGRSSKEPLVEDPDDEAIEKRSRHLSRRSSDINQFSQARSQFPSHSFSFQSSTVSYGGANGAYYTSSTTRRSGSDGLTFEESKEANSATGRATHRVSRGLHEKGHSVTRKLKPDGHVDSMQTLHNLNQDELPGFEDSWNGSARRHLPGWNEHFAIQDVTGTGASRQQQHTPNRVGWALPSNEPSNNTGSIGAGMAGPQQHLNRSIGGNGNGTGTSHPRFKSTGSGFDYQVNRR